jgi:hypothetical protein
MYYALEYSMTVHSAQALFGTEHTTITFLHSINHLLSLMDTQNVFVRQNCNLVYYFIIKY